MDMTCFQVFKHPHLTYVSLVFTVLLSSAFSEDPNPLCSADNRAGLPACDFNNAPCYLEQPEDGETLAWTRITEADVGPVQPYEGAYMYLDYTKSNGQPRKMEAVMSSSKKAICAKFFYATKGSAIAPINVYLKHNTTYSLMHEVKASTKGLWHSTEFFCCLPKVLSIKNIVIEATSTKDSVVAIDYMDIRVSDMACENDRLVCYPRRPSLVPLEPEDNMQRCPGDEGGEIETGAQSCDFSAEFSDSPDYCGWQPHRSSVWEGKQKFDGTGVYDTILSRKKGNSLVSAIDDNVTSLCVEVEFALGTIQADLTNAFSLHVLDATGNTREFWRSAQNYEGRNTAEWKRNFFLGCLPAGTGRQIQLTSNRNYLKIEYIHMRKSIEKCPIDKPTQQLSTTTAAATSENLPTTSSTTASPESSENLGTVRQQSPKEKTGGDGGEGGGVSVGVIAGTVVAILVVVALAGVATLFYLRRRSNRSGKMVFFKKPSPSTKERPAAAFENALFDTQ